MKCCRKNLRKNLIGAYKITLKKSDINIASLAVDIGKCLRSENNEILADSALVWSVIHSYVPSVLVNKLGEPAIMEILNSEKLQAYRNAIIGKKIASMAFYRFGMEWDHYLKKVKKNFLQSLHEAFV